VAKPKTKEELSLKDNDCASADSETNRRARRMLCKNTFKQHLPVYVSKMPRVLS
jgi:hypothetical protein